MRVEQSLISTELEDDEENQKKQQNMITTETLRPTHQSSKPQQSLIGTELEYDQDVGSSPTRVIFILTNYLD